MNLYSFFFFLVFFPCFVIDVLIGLYPVWQMVLIMVVLSLIMVVLSLGFILRLGTCLTKCVKGREAKLVPL
jgi:hypothetical protein